LRWLEEQAFNMQVIYYDKMRRLEAEENLGVKYVSLNVVLTPHMATHTAETRQLMVAAVTEDIRRVLSGKPPLNLVPEQRKKDST